MANSLFTSYLAEKYRQKGELNAAEVAKAEAQTREVAPNALANRGLVNAQTGLVGKQTDLTGENALAAKYDNRIVNSNFATGAVGTNAGYGTRNWPGGAGMPPPNQNPMLFGVGLPPMQYSFGVNGIDRNSSTWRSLSPDDQNRLQSAYNAGSANKFYGNLF